MATTAKLSLVCLHSIPHCGQPNHTSCSRAHSRCNTANSVHIPIPIVVHIAMHIVVTHTVDRQADHNVVDNVNKLQICLFTFYFFS